MLAAIRRKRARLRARADYLRYRAKWGTEPCTPGCQDGDHWFTMAQWEYAYSAGSRHQWRERR